MYDKRQLMIIKWKIYMCATVTKLSLYVLYFFVLLLLLRLLCGCSINFAKLIETTIKIKGKQVEKSTNITVKALQKQFLLFL